MESVSNITSQFYRVTWRRANTSFLSIRLCPVSFADDCRHSNVTSLNAERGHIALYPRIWRSTSDYVIIERYAPCSWLIEADPGRRITVYWARSPYDVQQHVSAAGKQTSTGGASATGCHVTIEFVERGEVADRREACRHHGDITMLSTTPLFESKGSQVEVRVAYNLTDLHHATEQRHANTGLLFILRYVGK
jgi:hypothetical protein